MASTVEYEVVVYGSGGGGAGGMEEGGAAAGCDVASHPLPTGTCCVAVGGCAGAPLPPGQRGTHTGIAACDCGTPLPLIDKVPLDIAAAAAAWGSDGGGGAHTRAAAWSVAIERDSSGCVALPLPTAHSYPVFQVVVSSRDAVPSMTHAAEAGVGAGLALPNGATGFQSTSCLRTCADGGVPDPASRPLRASRPPPLAIDTYSCGSAKGVTCGRCNGCGARSDVAYGGTLLVAGAIIAGTTVDDLPAYEEGATACQLGIDRCHAQCAFTPLSYTTLGVIDDTCVAAAALTDPNAASGDSELHNCGWSCR